MDLQLRHQLWIALAAIVIFFTNLGATRLWDDDEAIYASCAQEMLGRGDWVVPRYNGEIFFDKPPLMFWLMIAGFKLFGVTEFAARFSSAVLALGTGLLTYHLGRRLFRAEVGFWAGLIVVSNVIFTVSARAATVDSAITFLTALAMLLFVLTWRRASDESSSLPAQEEGQGARGSGVPCPSSQMPLPPALSRRQRAAAWLLWAAIYACMGVAILAKGPVGMLLPIATIGLFLLIVNQPIALEPSQPSGRGRRIARWLVAAARPLAPRNVLRAVWTMRPLTAVIVVLAVALPWYVLVGLRTDGAWLEQFFARYNVGPFLKPSLGHRGPLVYHFLAIFVGLFPWAVLLVPTLLRAARQVRLRDAWRPGYILLWCWTGVFFVFWSACSTKLPHYVLPAYPALALLMGCFVHDWLTDPSRLGRLVPRHVAATLILVGLGILAAAPVVTAFFAPGEWPVGLVGLAPVLGGGLYLFYERRAQPRRMVAVLAVTAVAFLAAVFAVAAQRIDRHQHSAPLVKAIRDASPTTPQIAGYRFLQGSIVYYAGQPLPCCENAKQLHRFVARWPQPYIITTSRYEPEIERQFPGQFHVLARRPRFLRCQEDVLVLTRGDNTASPHVAGGTGTLIDTDRR